MGDEMGNQNATGLQASEEEVAVASTDVNGTYNASLVPNDTVGFKDAEDQDIPKASTKMDDVAVLKDVNDGLADVLELQAPRELTTKETSKPQIEAVDDEKCLSRNPGDDLQILEQHDPETITNEETPKALMESDDVDSEKPTADYVADDLTAPNQQEVEGIANNRSLKASEGADNAEELMVTNCPEYTQPATEQQNTEAVSKDTLLMELIMPTKENDPKYENQAIVAVQSVDSETDRTNCIPNDPSAVDQDLIQEQMPDNKEEEESAILFLDTPTTPAEDLPTLPVDQEDNEQEASSRVCGEFRTGGLWEEETRAEDVPESDAKEVQLEDPIMKKSNLGDTSGPDLIIGDDWQAVTVRDDEIHKEKVLLSSDRVRENDETGEQECPKMEMAENGPALLEASESFNSVYLNAIDTEIKRMLNEVPRAADELVNKETSRREESASIDDDNNEKEISEKRDIADCLELNGFGVKVEIIDSAEDNDALEDHVFELPLQTIEGKESGNEGQDKPTSPISEGSNGSPNAALEIAEMAADVLSSDLEKIQDGREESELESNNNNENLFPETWLSQVESVITNNEKKTEDIDATQSTAEEMDAQLNQESGDKAGEEPNATMPEEQGAGITSEETDIVVSPYSELQEVQNILRVTAHHKEPTQQQTALESELQANMESLIIESIRETSSVLNTRNCSDNYSEHRDISGSLHLASENENRILRQDEMIRSADQMTGKPAEVIIAGNYDTIVSSAKQFQNKEQEHMAVAYDNPNVSIDHLECSKEDAYIACDSPQDRLNAEAIKPTVVSCDLEGSHPKTQVLAGSTISLEVVAVKLEKNLSADEEKAITCDGFAIEKHFTENEIHNVINKPKAETSYPVPLSSNEDSEKSPLLNQKKTNSEKLIAPLHSLMKEEPLEKDENPILKKTVEELWRSPTKKPLATIESREKQKPRSSFFSSCMCCSTAALN